MCTLVLAWQVFPDTSVAVAANRDEALDRPAEPPHLVEENPAVVAPLDEQAGGTWIGYNEHGLFVGLSNRWTDTELTGNRSRGLLVRDLLRTHSTDSAGHALEEAVRANEYEAFNLVVADAEQALVFEWDGRLQVTELDPGVHAVLNAGWNDQFIEVKGREEYVARQQESAYRIRHELAVESGETAAEWLERAAAALGDHDFGVCVHRGDFGTRSSSLIALRSDSATYRFADGPPCETAFATVEAQV